MPMLNFRQIILTLNTPEVKANIGKWVQEAGVKIQPERIGKIFHGYPLNPGEGDVIVTTLHENGLLGSHSLAQWRESVAHYRASTTNVPEDAVKMLIGDTKITNPSTFRSGWVDYIQPQAFLDRDTASEKLTSALGVSSVAFLEGKLTSSRYGSLMSAFKNRTHISEQLRPDLHKVIDNSGSKPLTIHNTLDEAINHYNETVFEAKIVKERTGWRRSDRDPNKVYPREQSRVTGKGNSYGRR